MSDLGRTWAKPDGGYCSRRPSPSPTRGSRFVGAPEVGPWVGEPKPLGKTHFGGNPSRDMTYLPTSHMPGVSYCHEGNFLNHVW